MPLFQSQTDQFTPQWPSEGREEDEQKVRLWCVVGGKREEGGGGGNHLCTS